MTPDLICLFTYGTLKKGFDNAFAQRLHSNSNFLGGGYFQGRLYQIDWYPGAIYESGSDWKVFGEVFQIHDPRLLHDLDEYEDVLEDEAASLYLRREVPIFLEDGTTKFCLTYIYNKPVEDLKMIASGIFTN